MTCTPLYGKAGTDLSVTLSRVILFPFLSPVFRAHHVEFSTVGNAHHSSHFTVHNGAQKSPGRLLQTRLACLQMAADAYTVYSQVDPSNSDAKNVAGWFDSNLACSTLTSCLRQNKVGWLCCSLCKTRRKLMAAEFGTSFTATLNIAEQTPRFCLYTRAHSIIE